MAFFKKLATKVTADVKEVVKEEAGKTKEELKKGFVNTMIDILPHVAMFVAAAILITIIKKPTPVVVKVVVDHV